MEAGESVDAHWTKVHRASELPSTLDERVNRVKVIPYTEIPFNRTIQPYYRTIILLLILTFNLNHNTFNLLLLLILLLILH